jgi:hypothetical protein
VQKKFILLYSYQQIRIFIKHLILAYFSNKAEIYYYKRTRHKPQFNKYIIEGEREEIKLFCKMGLVKQVQSRKTIQDFSSTMNPSKLGVGYEIRGRV